MKAYPQGELLATPGVRNAPPYVPGLPVSRIARQLGIDPLRVTKLASNENAYGCSPRAKEAYTAAGASLHRYPDGGAMLLREAIAARYGLPVDAVVCGNGSNELIELLARTYGGPGHSIVFGETGFIVYRLAALHSGSPGIPVPMRQHGHDAGAMLAAAEPSTRLVFLATPNNPTGVETPAEEIEEMLEGLPKDTILCLDEAYTDYLDEPRDWVPWIREGYPLILLRTFSKAFGLASLRLGYALGRPDLIAQLHRLRDPFNANGPALAAALAAWEDTAFVRFSRERNAVDREALAEILRARRIGFTPSAGNFLMATVGDGPGFAEALLRRGVIVRPLQPYRLFAEVRISVRTAGELAHFSQALDEVMAAGEWTAPTGND